MLEIKKLHFFALKADTSLFCHRDIPTIHNGYCVSNAVEYAKKNDFLLNLWSVIIDFSTEHTLSSIYRYFFHLLLFEHLEDSCFKLDVPTLFTTFFLWTNIILNVLYVWRHLNNKLIFNYTLIVCNSFCVISSNTERILSNTVRETLSDSYLYCTNIGPYRHCVCSQRKIICLGGNSARFAD